MYLFHLTNLPTLICFNYTLAPNKGDVINKTVRTAHSACRAWKSASNFSASSFAPYCGGR